LANRVITVGSQKRAEKIAAFCDGGLANMTKIVSGRGFCTLTGTYNGVPVSVVSIGMVLRIYYYIYLYYIL
jgi:uridine phosphorylase